MRAGAEYDVNNVNVLFTKLGFETVVYKDFRKNVSKTMFCTASLF
jgi:hypothetical protein